MSLDSAKPTGNGVTHLPLTSRAESVREFRGSVRGKFRGENAKPLAFEISQGGWNDVASGAMRAHVGDDKHAAKRLSRILECSPRTAENYLLGRTTPSGIHFLRAYAVIPEFTAEVRRLTGMQQSLDPEFERDLAAFLNRADKHLAQRRPDDIPG